MRLESRRRLFLRRSRELGGRYGQPGDPDLDGRSLAGSGIDAQPAAGQGRALLHRGQAEMTRHRLELLGGKPDAVVDHPDRVTVVALIEHDGRVVGVRMVADVREQLLRDAIENRARLQRRLFGQVVLEPMAGRSLAPGLIEIQLESR